MASASPNPAANGPAERSGALVDWIARFGAVVIYRISAIGDWAIFSLSTFAWMARRLPSRGTLLPNFYQIGVLSLPVVALTGTFIGMVLAEQSYAQFRFFHLETRLGGVINIVRAPVDRNAISLESAYGNENSPDLSLAVSRSMGPWAIGLASELFRTDGYIAVPADL